MALLTILITIIYIPVPNKIRDIHIVYYDKKIPYNVSRQAPVCLKMQYNIEYGIAKIRYKNFLHYLFHIWNRLIVAIHVHVYVNLVFTFSCSWFFYLSNTNSTLENTFTFQLCWLTPSFIEPKVMEDMTMMFYLLILTMNLYMDAAVYIYGWFFLLLHSGTKQQCGWVHDTPILLILFINLFIFIIF